MISQSDVRQYNKYAKKLGLAKKTKEELENALAETNSNISDINAELTKKSIVKDEITRKERQIRGKSDYILTATNISQDRFNEITTDIFNLDNEIKGMYQFIAGDISETDMQSIKNNKIDVVELDEEQRKDYATFIVDVTNLYFKEDEKTVFEKNILEFTEQGYNKIVPIAEPNDTKHFNKFIEKVKSTIVNVKMKNGKTSITTIGNILKVGTSDKDLIKLVIYCMKRGGKFNIWGNSDNKIEIFLDQISKSNATWLYFKNLLRDDIIEVY